MTEKSICWFRRLVAIRLFCSVLAVFLCGPVVAQDAALPFVPIPCKGGSGQASSCPVGLQECSKLQPELVKGFRERLKKSIDLYYAGQVASLSGSSTGEIEFTPVGGPVCNVNPFVPSPQEGEVFNNHKGRSCGNEAKFSAKAPSDEQMVGVAAAGMTPLATAIAEFKLFMDLTDGPGRFQSYMRGAWVAARIWARNQVLAELEQKKGIQANEACASLATDLNLLMAAGERLSTGVEPSLCNAENLSEIEQCKAPVEPGTSPPVPVGSTDGASPGVQSACYLAAARQMITNGGFDKLLLCKAESMADEAYDRLFKSQEGINAIVGQLSNAIESHRRSFQKCWLKAYKKSKMKKCIASQAQKAFKKSLAPVFRALLAQHFPCGGKQCALD